MNLELGRGTFLFISNTSEDHVTMMIVTSLIFKFVDMNVELLLLKKIITASMSIISRNISNWKEFLDLKISFIIEDIYIYTIDK